MTGISIRKEEAGDIETIDAVTQAAFATAPHSGGNEHRIVAALRQRGTLAVSLVAERNGALVGHVALSPVRFDDRPSDWLGLGPISVLPEEQGKGIGSALMNAAIDAMKDRGAGGCVLLGNPGFYARFGFEPTPPLAPDWAPKAYFLARRLGGEWPEGKAAFDRAFAEA